MTVRILHHFPVNSIPPDWAGAAGGCDAREQPPVPECTVTARRPPVCTDCTFQKLTGCSFQTHTHTHTCRKPYRSAPTGGRYNICSITAGRCVFMVSCPLLHPPSPTRPPPSDACQPPSPNPSPTSRLPGAQGPESESKDERDWLTLTRPPPRSRVSDPTGLVKSQFSPGQRSEVMPTSSNPPATPHFFSPNGSFWSIRGMSCV